VKEHLKNFFEGRARYPKYKVKGKSKPSFFVERIKFIRDKDNRLYVKIEKLDTPILLCKDARKYKGIENAEWYDFRNPRISFNGRRWQLSFSVEVTFKTGELTDEVIGIDLGIKKAAVCSDGTAYANINKISKKLKKLEKREKRLQRRISRKFEMNKQGNKYIKTKNILKLYGQLVRLRNRMTNIRHDYLHKISREIVNRLPRAIVMEDLNVKGMLKNKHLSRDIQKQAFHTFRTFVQYKAERKGINFILADRKFKSTQICSRCGNVQKISLGERKYKCPVCGLEIDRDLNAAINLKNYGEHYLNTQVS
jgi:putative transposase